MSSIPTSARRIVNTRSGGLCERCGMTGTEIHHRKRGHPRLHAVPNLIRLCGPCHQFATVQPVDAERTGLVLTGTVTAESAAKSPVLLLGSTWVNLTLIGGYKIGQFEFGDMQELFNWLLS